MPLRQWWSPKSTVFFVLLLCCVHGLVRAAQHSESPLVLHEVISEALQGHPLVLSRQAEHAAAGFVVDQAQAQFFPSPYLRAEGHQGKSIWLAGASQPLWSGGRLTAQLQSAEADREVAGLSVDEVRLETALRIAAAWYESVSAVARLKVARSGLEELAALENMMRNRVSTGFSAAVDLHFVQARHTEAQVEVRAIESELRASLNRLEQLAGRRIAVEQLPAPTPVLGANIDANLDTAAIAGHPAWRRAQADVDRAQAQLRLASRTNAPLLALRAEYQIGVHPASAASGYRMFIGLEQSFGAGNSSAAAVNAARAQVQASQERVEHLRRDLISQFMSDQQSLITALDRSESLAVNIQNLGRVAQSYRRSFDAGVRPWLDLLNALKEHTDAQQQQVRAMVDAAFHHYRLGTYQWSRP